MNLDYEIFRLKAFFSIKISPFSNYNGLELK